MSLPSDPGIFLSLYEDPSVTLVNLYTQKDEYAQKHKNIEGHKFIIFTNIQTLITDFI